MEKFVVRNKKKLEIAKILYNSKTRKWSMSINERMDLSTCPVMLYCMANKRKYKLNNEWTTKFIRERIIPPSRQNINSFLKKYKIKEYNEYDLLKLNKGKCCMDDCYIDYKGFVN